MEAYFGPIRTSLLFFPLAAMLMLPFFALFHYRRYGHVNSYRAFLFYTFLFYGMCAYSLVILPLPELTADYLKIYGGTHKPQLHLFSFVTEIEAVFPDVHHGFTTASLIKFFLHNMTFLQVFFNLLLLLPLGFYLRQLYKLTAPKVLFLGFLTTLFFECSQYSGLFGLYPAPYRLFDVDDLLLNTLGAVAGYYLSPLLVFLPPSEDLHYENRGKIPVFARLGALILDIFFKALLTALVLAGLGLSAASIPAWLLNCSSIIVWFVLVPILWKGHTLGKKLFGIQIVDNRGKSATPWQLLVRAAVLLLIPMLINGLTIPQPQADGFVDGVEALRYLLLLPVEFGLFMGLILLRKDRKGPHELASGRYLRSRINHRDCERFGKKRFESSLGLEQQGMPNYLKIIPLTFLILLIQSSFACAENVFGKSPAPGANINSTIPVISATFQDGMKPDKIFVDGREFTGQARKNGNQFYLKPDYQLDYGQHTVRVEGRGLFGIKVHDEWSFKIVNGPASGGWTATVAAVTPPNRQTIQLSRPTISARFSGQVRAASTQIWIDGREFTGQSRRSNTSISVTPSYNLDAGTHRVHLRAVSSNGVKLQKDWAFSIQNGAIQLPANANTTTQVQVAPGKGSTVRVNRPKVSANFATGVQVQSLRMHLDGTNVTNLTRRGPHRIDFVPSQPLSVGTHKVKVVAKDKFGNKIVEHWNFKVGAAAQPHQPKLQVQAPARNATVQRRFIVAGKTIAGGRVQIVIRPGKPKQHVFEGWADGNGDFSVQVRAPKGQQSITVIPFNRRQKPGKGQSFNVTVQH